MGSSNRELGVPAPRCEGEGVSPSAALGPLALPLLETLITTAPVGFALLDTDLRFVLVNRALAEINGRPVEDHAGRTLQEVVPALADVVAPRFREVLASGQPLRELELSGEVASSPGAQRHWLESVHPVPGPDGRPAALAVLVWEVTGRRRAEMQRAEMLAVLDMVLLRAPIGFAFLDRDLRYVRINETLAELNGVPVEAHLGRTVREVLPALADDIEPLLRRVLDTRRALVDVEVETGETPRNPGRRRHWLVSYYPVPAPEGERPYGLGLLVNDVTEHHEREEERARLLAAERAARAAAERAAERQMLLQRLTAQLGRAATIGEVAAVAISTVPAALGAEAAMVYRNDEGTFRLLAVTGLPESVVAGWETFTLEATAPAVDALRAGRPVLVRSRAERDRRYPFLTGTAVTQAAWANLPLRVAGRTVGFVALGWAQPRTFTGEEAELLTAVASQCATALDRARLLAAEQATRAAAETARARLAFLARASDVLSGSLNEAETLDRLARLIVHDRADWCTVLLPDGRGHLVPRVCVHADPAKAPLAAQVPSTGPFEIAGPAPAADVYRSGRPVLAPHLDRQAFTIGTDPRLADVAERLGLGSGMLLPMVARGRTMGVLSIVAGPDRPPFTPPDLDLYADLARRAAVALDNARLFGQRSRIASRLQESLLPTELPAVAGLDLAVRYVTAEEAVDVGGDFYDVFPTGPDEWLVVIGDVAGRGIDAAGVTGLARQTLRAIGHDLGPAAALRRLNDLLYAQQTAERFLTAACGRLTRRGDGAFDLTLACGGHALPLLRHADGHAELVGEPGTLLGALPSVDCPETRHVLGPGDTLLLYTDGVVEARGPQGLFGEERLARVVTACPAGGADVLAACVERAVVDYRTEGAADDLALLVVRVDGDG